MMNSLIKELQNEGFFVESKEKELCVRKKGSAFILYIEKNGSKIRQIKNSTSSFLKNHNYKDVIQYVNQTWQGNILEACKMVFRNPFDELNGKVKKRTHEMSGDFYLKVEGKELISTNKTRLVGTVYFDEIFELYSYFDELMNVSSKEDMSSISSIKELWYLQSLHTLHPVIVELQMDIEEVDVFEIYKIKKSNEGEINAHLRIGDCGLEVQTIKVEASQLTDEQIVEKINVCHSYFNTNNFQLIEERSFRSPLKQAGDFNSITYYDGGNALASALRFGEEENSLVLGFDLGVGLINDTFETTHLHKELKDLYRVGIDVVVVSHWHGDHYMGFYELDSNEVYHKPWLVKDEPKKQSARILLSVIQSISAYVGNKELYMLSNSKEYNIQLHQNINVICCNKGSTNEKSMILFYEKEQEKILLMSDAGYNSIAEVHPSCLDGISFLQVGHHGGELDSKSYPTPFNEHSVALLPTGFNVYGHPSLLEKKHYSGFKVERISKCVYDAYPCKGIECQKKSCLENTKQDREIKEVYSIEDIGRIKVYIKR